METTFQKIIRKTGKKPTNCKCKECKLQCGHPCLGTPDDLIKILESDFAKRTMIINWTGAMDFKLYDKPITMMVPLYDEVNKSCTFFTDGLCELHNSGLKPTEGKLSHHSTTLEKFNVKKSIGWAVSKEWLSIPNEKLNKLIELFNSTHPKL